VSKCPVCKSKEARQFLTGDVLKTIRNPKGFPVGEVVICAKCGVLYDRKHYETFKKNGVKETNYIC